MKRILLKLDEEMFYKLKKDKFKMERILDESFTWEEYIQILFGFGKKLNKHGGKK